MERRRGAGAVVVVVVVVLIILLTFVGTVALRSRGVTTIVVKSTQVETCERLTDLALTEARHRLRTRLDDPTDELAHTFRAMLQQSGGATAFTLGHDALPQLAARRPTGYGLAGPGVVAELVRWAPLAVEPTERSRFEVTGTRRLSCQVVGPQGGSSRAVEEYGFRTAFTAVPPPFDGATFLLLRPQGLLDAVALEGGADGSIRYAVERMLYWRRVAEWARRLLDGAGSAVPAAAATMAQRLIDVVLAHTAWTVADVTSDGPGTVHLFGPATALYSLDERVDLDRLCLPRRLRPVVAAIERVRPAAEALEARVERALSGAVPGAADLAAMAAGVDRLEEFLSRLDEMLGVYRDFQDAVVEVVGPGFDGLQMRSRRLDAAEFRARADFVFRGADAAERATAFLDGERNPTGVVYVALPAGARPFEVHLADLRGRLVLAVDGPMVVRQATVRDGERDALVLVGYGAVELAGPTSAAVVAWGGALRVTDGSSAGHRGSLVIRDLPVTTDFEALLQGTLEALPALLTGPSPSEPRNEVIHAAFSPRARYRTVDFGA